LITGHVDTFIPVMEMLQAYTAKCYLLHLLSVE